MSQEYGPATWIPTTHCWAGRRGYTPRWIILHASAGGTSAESVARYFQSDDPPSGAHYIIGLQGEVAQCVSETDSAWANGVLTQGHDAWWSPQINPNFLTLSIEHVKPDGANRNQLTQVQRDTSFALIKHLCEKWNIPMRPADATGGITGHQSIDPLNRASCPGPYPWNELWAYLRDAQATTPTSAPLSGVLPGIAMPAGGPIGAPLSVSANGGISSAGSMGSGGPTAVSPTTTTPGGGVPAGWRDDGAALTAPNGYPVKLAFRAYVLSHAWDADNWPLDLPQTANPVDITNPQSGGGSVQHFRKSILVWEEATSAVYERWAGATALAWEQRAGATPAASMPASYPGSSYPAAYNPVVAYPGSSYPAAYTPATSYPGSNYPAAPAAAPSNGPASAPAYAPAGYSGGYSGAPATSAPSTVPPVLPGATPVVAGPPIPATSAIASAALIGAGAIGASGFAYAPAASILPSSQPAGTLLPSSLPAVAASAATSSAKPPLAYVPSPQSAAVSVQDMLGQRVNQLESDLRTLFDNLGGSPKARRKLANDLRSEAGDIGELLTSAKVRRSIFANPKSVVRWILMILGLLFSDAVAWVISAFAHNTPHLPIPFLTVGTVGTVIGGVAFLAAATLRPHA